MTNYFGLSQKSQFNVPNISELSAAFSYSLQLLSNLVSVGVWLCSCVYTPPGCPSQQILSILLYLEHSEVCYYFKPLAGPCVCCGVASPPENACNSRIPLIPFSFRLYARLPRVSVRVFCHWLVPGSFLLVDHKQSNSINSLCHLFSPLPLFFFSRLLFPQSLQFIELYLSPLILFFSSLFLPLLFQYLRSIPSFSFLFLSLLLTVLSISCFFLVSFILIHLLSFFLLFSFLLIL